MSMTFCRGARCRWGQVQGPLAPQQANRHLCVLSTALGNVPSICLLFLTRCRTQPVKLAGLQLHIPT